MNMLEMNTMVVYSEMGYKIDSKAEVHCPPRVGEQLIMKGKVYRVSDVIHDYDDRKFVVIVEESEKFNKFIKR